MSTPSFHSSSDVEPATSAGSGMQPKPSSLLGQATPNANPSRPLLLTYGLPALLACLGAVFGSYFTYVQTSRANENDYRLHIASTIKDAAANLSSSKTSAVTFAGLYAFARPNDDEYRRILMTIGYTTSFPNVQMILAEFINSDTEMQKIRDDPLMTKIAQAAATVKADTSAAQSVAANAGKNPAEVAVAKAKVAPTPGEVALLTAAVPKPPDIGWVYYGRVGSSGNDPNECLDPKAPVPRAGTKATLCSARYVRDAPSAAIGRVLTALAEGTSVAVLDNKPYQLSHGARAIWLKIKLP